MRISDARDLQALRAGFTRWLRARVPTGTEVSVAPIGRPDAGLSAETLFIEAEVTEPGRAPAPRALVARLPPTGDGLFPVYDFAGQASVQRHLAAAGVPAVDPVAVEEDPAWIGAPFLVMARVPGRTVRNDAPFLRKGWLAEAAPEAQATLHDNLLDVLAHLHRLPVQAAAWDEPGRRFLSTGTTGRGDAFDALPARLLPASLARWSAYLEWAAQGDAPSALEEAKAWCEAHLPAHEPPPSVLWGDVQFGNMVVGDDMGIAAILDFELAAIGPAELDVAWFQVLHAMTVSSCGGDLPGFPDPATTRSRYEERLGRALDDLRWYEVFAAFRSGAIMVRAARLLTRQGVDDTWLTNGNPVMDLIGELIARDE